MKKSDSFLTEEQQVQVQNFISNSPEKSVFVKLGERTPKDINPFLQQVHNVEELATVLTTSEYLMEPLEPSQ